MRAMPSKVVLTVSALGSALALAACDADAPDPLAPLLSSGDSRGAVVAAEPPPALPFHGTLEATETHTPTGAGTVLIHGTGAGTATHLGRYTLEFDLVGDLATGSAESVIRLTAANGDVLTATSTGQASIAADFMSLTVVEAATITGGTGRFAGATGSFAIDRVIDLTTGPLYVTTGTFRGSITFARPAASP